MFFKVHAIILQCYTNSNTKKKYKLVNQSRIENKSILVRKTRKVDVLPNPDSYY